MDQQKNLPHGPQTATEALMWAPRVFADLSKRGLVIFQQDYADELCQKFSEGLAVRTDYSGLGGAEEVVRHLLIAAQEYKP